MDWFFWSKIFDTKMLVSTKCWFVICDKKWQKSFSRQSKYEMLIKCSLTYILDTSASLWPILYIFHGYLILKFDFPNNQWFCHTVPLSSLRWLRNMWRIPDVTLYTDLGMKIGLSYPELGLRYEPRIWFGCIPPIWILGL